MGTKRKGVADKEHSLAVDTAAKKILFVAALLTGRSPGCAAAVLEIARSTAYAWKTGDADFAQKWDDAVETALDRLETVAYDMAVVDKYWPAVEWNLKWRRKEKYQNTENADRTVSHTNYFLNAPLEEHYARLERLGLPAPVIEPDYEVIDVTESDEESNS